MKYIIDIEDWYTKDWVIDTPMGKELCMPISVPNRNRTYHVLTGFKIEPYTDPDRKAIEDEVWELARRIICPSDCCVDSISAHTKEIFNKEGWEIRGIFNDLSYQEAKSKYEAWLKQKDEIHVGDEVYPCNPKAPRVVTKIENRVAYQMGYDGNMWADDISDLHKTGRHFPEVAQLLEKMRGDNG